VVSSCIYWVCQNAEYEQDDQFIKVCFHINIPFTIYYPKLAKYKFRCGSQLAITLTPGYRAYRRAVKLISPRQCLLTFWPVTHRPSTPSPSKMEAPRNRKQRRAAAGSSSSNDEPEITMAHPPRNDPTKNKPTVERTLYDIIAERQSGLHQKGGAISASAEAQGIPPQSGGTRFVTVDASGELVDTDGDISSHLASNASQKKTKKRQQGTNANIVKQSDSDFEPDKPLPPFLDTILLSLPLTTLHLTLSYLAAHQYAERIDLPKLLKESVTTAFPLLTLFVHLAHGHIISSKKRSSKNAKAETAPLSLFPLTSDKLTVSFLRRLVFPPALKTLVFLPVAAVLGAHLIAITNGEPYYAVMKKAPAVGTIWIWCILELSFGAALLGALGPLVWGVWWMGYGIV
jgi:hypothetical protein